MEERKEGIREKSLAFMTWAEECAHTNHVHMHILYETLKQNKERKHLTQKKPLGSGVLTYKSQPVTLFHIPLPPSPWVSHSALCLSMAVMEHTIWKIISTKVREYQFNVCFPKNTVACGNQAMGFQTETENALLPLFCFNHSDLFSWPGYAYFHDTVTVYKPCAGHSGYIPQCNWKVWVPDSWIG